MLSYTEHCNFGQYNGSPGRGSVNLIQVLIVGLAPAGPGCVLIFSMAAPRSGGTKLFKLN